MNKRLLKPLQGWDIAEFFIPVIFDIKKIQADNEKIGKSQNLAVIREDFSNLARAHGKKSQGIFLRCEVKFIFENENDKYLPEYIESGLAAAEGIFDYVRRDVCEDPDDLVQTFVNGNGMRSEPGAYVRIIPLEVVEWGK